MKKEPFIQLVDSYLTEKATAEEKQLVERYYQKLLDNETPKLSSRKDGVLEKSMFEGILKQIQIPQPQQKKHFTFWPRIIAAASVVLVIGVGIYFYIGQHNSELVTYATNLKPGGNKAILTLANGKRISLSDAVNGEVVEEDGVKISKTANGELVYEASSGQRKSQGEVLNTIETPKGGQYQVHLPDGTRIWLNAASKLKYPVNFVSEARKVELSGEAYFEVAKDKVHPFIVKNVGQEVTVLGTHFNINGYSDENSIKTTLLEGAVKVTGNKGANVLLVPGQQSILKDDAFEIKQAEPEADLAWKMGYFSFNDDNIQHVMLVLSRWYDIEVSYQGNITSDGFNGKFSRYKEISQVLKVLEKSKLVHFKVQGRKVLVTN